ncbi:MAG: hypothetical protein IPJ40_22165 [Saprospirales bacterium]|nr:hypothetical protein [Saprospirales bacterium]
MYKFSILIGFFLLTAGVHAAGQEIPRVHAFTSQEYQAQRQNWSITQATDRWMYFANSAGVLEYDGNRWQLLPLPNRQVARAVGYAREKVFCGGFAEFGFWEKSHLGSWTYTSL